MTRYYCFYTTLTRPPLTSTLFPYTTLFRSRRETTTLTSGGVWSPPEWARWVEAVCVGGGGGGGAGLAGPAGTSRHGGDRKSTRLNSSHVKISYAVFCLKKKIKSQMR